MDSISRLRDNAFLVRRTQTARPFRVFWLDRFVRKKKENICETREKIRHLLEEGTQLGMVRFTTPSMGRLG